MSRCCSRPAGRQRRLHPPGEEGEDGADLPAVPVDAGAQRHHGGAAATNYELLAASMSC